MSRANMRDDGSRTNDTDDEQADTANEEQHRRRDSFDEFEMQLETIGEQLEQTDCDELTKIGVYSIHESSARMITLPTDADGFDESSRVAIYCYETGNRQLLIAAPISI